MGWFCRILGWVAVLALGMAAPTGVAAPVPQPPLVLAAASLQEALEEAASAWAEQGHPRPVLSFAGSSALARQVDAGATADLFISADADWMDDVARHGWIVADSRAVMARNRLVLVAAKDSRIGWVRRPARELIPALGRDGRLAMADPDAVPAGKYGKAALIRLGAWGAVVPRVVAADNVRAALALVERGAAPLAVVYATDARASSAVRVVGIFPESSHAPILYPIARLRSSTSPDAEGFRRFLLSSTGQAILARHGFARP